MMNLVASVALLSYPDLLTSISASLDYLIIGAIYLPSNLIDIVPQRCFSVVRGHIVLIYGISA